MSYTALYRKFRPLEFEDVKGQEHIVTTLKNQIKFDRIGHAYLFCGTRGTGKTTVAKIFAKAVNCEHPIDGSPCNECETCKAINTGSSLNVIEIDAASNNGVDNIREIRDEVSYSPTSGKYKVYIIDEVHMLSIGAFNALLKTLEEPPSYVIFILATTEAHKIPITILSRCQRYDFKRIAIEAIYGRLKELSDKEQVEVEEKALRYIAKMGDGSLRDALSLLDQCIAFYLGKKLTYENALEVLGAVDTEVFSRMLRSTVNKDVLAAISQIDELIMQGRELSQFVSEFTWYLRNLMLVKTSDNIEEVLDVSSESLSRLKEESNMLELDVIMRYIRIFSELSNQVKYSTQKRVIIEITFIKLCKPAMEINLDSLVDRISSIEKQLENGVSLSPVVQMQQEPQREQAKPVQKSNVPLPKAISEDVRNVVKQWRGIVEGVSGLVKPYLKSAKLSVGNDDRLIIVFSDLMADGIVNTPERKTELEECIARNIGKTVEVDMRMLESGSSFEENYVDIQQVINMDIVIED
ncbi:DNA polymerase III subunit gamma/tau [Konateibacter massiliensis]|uniref:DNA polymerase III subunit gamma/tau n=1 Tax=Konateibacter massiliensis TaxID=2002841 RepID=UPI000C1550B8|nr:DNA polymerase III subunit gamma/tau [Konateibacter massiliensis]